MSLAALYSSNGDVVASSLDELNHILSDQYNENDTLIKTLSRRITCKGCAGYGWFTPDAMITRLVDHFSRLFENKGIVNKEYQSSYRMYHDIVLIIVPQVHKHTEASLTLSLVDSGIDLQDGFAELDGNTISISSADGPVIAVFHPNYSVCNTDRVKLNGKESHRRLGFRYVIETGGSKDPSTEVTYFAVSATWKRQMSLSPSYYEEQPPTVIPVRPGYREHAALKNPRLLKSALSAGLNLKHHMLAPHSTANDVNLATVEHSPLDASTIVTKPKPSVLPKQSSVKKPDESKANDKRKPRSRSQDAPRNWVEKPGLESFSIPVVKNTKLPTSIQKPRVDAVK